MERLNRQQRKRVYESLQESYIRSLNSTNSFSIWDLTHDEVNSKKLCSRLCSLLALSLGVSFNDSALFEISTDFLIHCRVTNDTNEGSDEAIEASYEMYGEIEAASQNFFYTLLKHTSWESYQIETFYDLEQLPDDLSHVLKDQIPHLLNYLQTESYYPSKDQFHVLLEHFASLGIEPCKYSIFDSCSILYLHNPVVSKAMRLCKEVPSLAALPEINEIQEYFQSNLFIRYFDEGFLHPETGEIAYMLGMCLSDIEEHSDFYYLSHEVALFLVLAEMAALDIIDRTSNNALKI